VERRAIRGISAADRPGAATHYHRHLALGRAVTGCPQRNREVEELGEEEAGAAEESEDRGSGPISTPSPPGPAPKTRYFGVRTLDPERYAVDFGKINAGPAAPRGPPGVQLNVRIEIEAQAPEGFDDTRIRTVSENAATLKFDRSSFEID